MRLYEIQNILAKRVGVLLKQNEVWEMDIANEIADSVTRYMLINKVYDNLIRLD